MPTILVFRLLSILQPSLDISLLVARHLSNDHPTPAQAAAAAHDQIKFTPSQSPTYGQVCKKVDTPRAAAAESLKVSPYVLSH